MYVCTASNVTLVGLVGKMEVELFRFQSQFDQLHRLAQEAQVAALNPVEPSSESEFDQLDRLAQEAQVPALKSDEPPSESQVDQLHRRAHEA